LTFDGDAAFDAEKSITLSMAWRLKRWRQNEKDPLAFYF